MNYYTNKGDYEREEHKLTIKDEYGDVVVEKAFCRITSVVYTEQTLLVFNGNEVLFEMKPKSYWWIGEVSVYGDVVFDFCIK